MTVAQPRPPGAPIWLAPGRGLLGRLCSAGLGFSANSAPAHPGAPLRVSKHLRGHPGACYGSGAQPQPYTYPHIVYPTLIEKRDEP